MLDLETIYDAYLDRLQEERENEHKKYKEWFSGSSAGSCYKKQWYKLREYEPKPFDARTKRLLRLGTIVHKDFEDAIIEHAYLARTEVYTEHEVKIPELKVIGHLDHCVVIKDNNKVDIYVGDLKTLASYSWTKKFGRDAKKRGINVHSILGHYELQVGTYALGMLLQIAPETFEPMLEKPAMFDSIDDFENDITLKIVWYNKNDSRMNITQIPNEAIKTALVYWQDLNDFIEECSDDIICDIPPGGGVGIPMMDWECNYCQFSKICKGS